MFEFDALGLTIQTSDGFVTIAWPLIGVAALLFVVVPVVLCLAQRWMGRGGPEQ